MQAASNPTQAMAASVLILSVSVIGKRLRSPFKAIVPYSASAANRRGYEAAVRSYGFLSMVPLTIVSTICAKWIFAEG